MSDHDDHNDHYNHDEMVDLIDDVIGTIMDGMLIWMDMTERLIEDSAHDERCDGNCSTGAVDKIFAANRDHLDRVVESFRTALTETSAIKDELTSDASKENDNEQ